MLLLSTLLVQLVVGGPDSAVALPPLRVTPPLHSPPGFLASTTDPETLPPETDTSGPRPKAVTYSDWYARRLTIHQWASWALLPLSVSEYVVGQELYKQEAGADPALKNTHQAIATGIMALFAVNTVTGGWNLWDARHDPNGRTRRMVHGISMLAADALFVAAAATAPGDDCGEGGGVCPPNSERASTHRTLAITAFSLSTASWVMMLFWRD